MSYAPRETHKASEPTEVRTEAPGPIASDSLAADSIRGGGDFGANEPTQPEPLSVKGASSTFANTDTSGAVPLHAAPSATAREIQDARGLGPDEKGHSGVKYPEGAGQSDATGVTTSEGHYYGASSGDRASDGYNTGMAAGASDFGASTFGSEEGGMSATGGIPSTASSGSAAVPTHEGGGRTSATSGTTSTSTSASAGGPTQGMGVRPHVPEGPTYTGVVAGTVQSQGEDQPKGSNLTEGDIPQTKTFLGDVGGQHDPGRLAERDFEKINAQEPGAGVGGGRDYGGGKEQDNPYDVLGSERA